MKKKDAIIIFAKPIESPNIKTRIAKIHGNEIASQIYRELLFLTAKITSELEITKYIYWDGIIPTEIYPFDFSYESRLQTGFDLGEKMQNAFSEVFATHENVCIIGSDCPGITKEIILDAFDSLKHTSDYAIGPCWDGGYYLLGLKEKPEFWFTDIEWSSDTVFQKTVMIGNIHSLRKHELPKLSDIDTMEDYKAWKKN